MRTIRIQTGHYGRTSGATGAYNPRLKIGEAQYNNLMAVEIERIVKSLPNDFNWEFVGPDERGGTGADGFIALHHDGSDNPAVNRPSVGYPPSSATSKGFAQVWKKRYGTIAGALDFRNDNYTRALSGYYGFSWTYSGTADFKVVVEFEFITADERVSWLYKNRNRLASELIASVYEYYGVSVPKSLFGSAPAPAPAAKLQPAPTPAPVPTPAPAPVPVPEPEVTMEDRVAKLEKNVVNLRKRIRALES